jgi:LmbE family N-acetylglucosaminyl deacetylase
MRLGLQLGRRLPPNVKRLLNAARGIDMPTVVPRPAGTRVAVLAPHPDDEVLGCGGTIQKHVAAGERVTVLMMTSGERTASFAGRSTDDSRSQREAEAIAACGVLGADVVFLRMPDGGVGDEAGPTLDDALRSVGADLVYAPNPVDAHRDHVATTRLLGGAVERSPEVERIALYEVWTPVYPNALVDIGHQLESKLAALDEYVSATEVVDYRHTIRGLNAYRAGHGLHGRGYAEAFCVLERNAFLELMGQLG